MFGGEGREPLGVRQEAFVKLVQFIMLATKIKKSLVIGVSFLCFICLNHVVRRPLLLHLGCTQQSAVKRYCL
jgi:hypothetical protein